MNSGICVPQKLANTKWRSDSKTLLGTSLALRYSAAECCALVWSHLSHAHKTDTELSQSCRIIRGTLKMTPTVLLYCLVGIAEVNGWM